jgi:hypothetical protein
MESYQVQEIDDGPVLLIVCATQESRYKSVSGKGADAQKEKEQTPSPMNQ